jgi:transcriptional regulator with XRE-family HTH domain
MSVDRRRERAESTVLYITLGRSIAQAREAIGATEKEAARVYCVSLKTYRKYEDGDPQKSGFGLYKFAKYFDVKFSWLRGEQNEKPEAGELSLH